MSKKQRVAIVIDLDRPFKFVYECFIGISRYASQIGSWECIIDPHAGETLARCGKQPPYDALIGDVNKRLLEQSRRRRMPVVNVWKNSPVFAQTPSVVSDEHQVGTMAAEHLIARGLRTFGYLGFRRRRDTRHQRVGFDAALARSGFKASTLLVSYQSVATYQSHSKFRRQLDEWVPTWKPPIGVFVGHDLTCRYLSDTALQSGLNVPNDVALIAAHNETAFNENINPTLSSIDLGHERIGYRAAELLAGLIEGEPPPEKPIYIAPTNLIVRQSTDVFAVDDPIVSLALRFISEHSHEMIRVDDVAESVAVSRRSLERKFQDVIARPIADEITRLRLERVKRRLVESDDSIQTVAVESGFVDSTKMCRVFRRELGVSPGEYRKSKR
ncbi:MAG: substrate-binding domain-containing protein [Planctomycetes bacterium]|nr:substrate-binding domain-containing protein [Planctomycetota bacterium]